MVHDASAAARFLVVLVTAQLCIASSSTVKSKTKIPCVLIFGDSTVDTGNNNFIITPFKGDHLPYGQDFPDRAPTGRFSNGKLVPDIMASIVGLKEAVPPFLDPNLSDKDIVTGVSFASAGSGYDDLTTTVSAVIPVSRQPEYFKKYIGRLQGIVGEREAARILKEAVVIISAGTNDFILNYFDLPTRSIKFSIGQYQDFLLAKLQDLVKKLYDLGCRKIVIAGIPPIGCLPIQMTDRFGNLGRCIEGQNKDSQAYNNKLEKLIPQMEAKLPGSTILYADIYNPFIDMINNPQKYGLTETKRGCCGSGLLEAGPLCTASQTVCPNPSNYLFFDSIHPTEAAYKILSESFKALIPKLSGSDSMF